MSGTYGSKHVPTPLKIIRMIARSLGTIAPSIAGRLALQLFFTPLKRNRKPAVFNPRQITFTHKGREIVGYEWHGTGDTILLVHGWESYAGRFKKLIGILLENNYRVVAMDAPAHGMSQGRQTNPQDYGEALYDFTKVIGDVHTVIAHSFGGAATMMLLNDHPSFKPKKVVTIGAVDHVHNGIKPFAKIIQLPDKAFPYMEAHAEQLIGDTLDSFSSSTLAQNRTEQALIIHDTDDNIIPVTSGHKIANAWQGAIMHETSGLGHRRILNDDAVLTTIVEFIAQDERVVTI